MGVLNRYKGTVLAADEHPVVVEGDWDRNKVVMLSIRERKGFSRVRWIRLNIKRYPKTGEPPRTDLYCWCDGFREASKRDRQESVARGLSSSLRAPGR